MSPTISLIRKSPKRSSPGIDYRQGIYVYSKDKVL